MDFRRPIESVIPGATGRLLGALARVEEEVPVSTLARVAEVGRTRASGIIGELTDLGVVTRHDVGRTVLVQLDRRSAAGRIIAELGDLHNEVIRSLEKMARAIRPQPLSLSFYGSFARGEAGADSDIDMLVIRPDPADDRWADELSTFTRYVEALTGNAVHALEYERDEFVRRATDPEEVGKGFWTAVCDEALTLTGAAPAALLSEAHDTPR